MYRKIGVIGLIVSMLLIGCGTKSQSTQSSSQAEGKDGGAREIHYFSSRSASDDTIVTLQEITDKYNEQGGKIKLVIDSNADRTSYDQKLRTMIAGGQMPDMFDLDATPYAAELGEKGMLTDMDAFLDEIGEKDSYIPLALDYGRTADGKLYTLPLELSTEMIWYNVDMFKDAGIGGGDGWPLLRLLATYPFRMTGNDFLNDLSTGKAKMSDEPGMKAAEFMSNIGKYFQPGFSTTDVATGLNLFLSGKSAMYPTGTWELNYFTDKNRPEGLNVDYFYMPTIKDAKTSSNDYWAFGGIGLSVNPKVFDEQYKDYLTFIVNNYSPAYFSHEHLAPQKVEMSDKSKFDPLFLKVMEDTNNIGTTAARPWDVVLNEDVIATINDNLPGLCMDEETPDEFVKAVDEALDANK